ncbi:DnaB-like helicase C-terminal domain-containing protein, partial [Myxococcota bacterium]|nr:DnaB-like helicase C-terminal domain-containing protein [Myxococcota bacterium]
MRATDTLSKLPIWIDDKPMMTVQEIRSKVRRLQRQLVTEENKFGCKKLGLVVVDYLQLMKGIREKGDSREREVASISQGLKNLAKNLGVPVLALSQLNRSVERKGSDKRPTMSDLRESGAIEQDADAIWLLYRDSYYQKDAGPEVEVDIAKQRNGPTGVVKL